MADSTATLQQFQEFVWDRLPLQRHKLGREVVNDVIAVAVQEWPDELLSQSKSGDSIELEAVQGLKQSVRRHMELVYGEEKFGSFWIIALQIMLPIIIDQMLRWWRRRKENRGRIRIWRRKWVDGTEG